MTSDFSDIASHWAAVCIRELAQRNLVSGYPDGRFRPEATITRAEFASLMYRVFPDAQPIRAGAGFVDVPETHWARVAIAWVYERGFFSGYPDQTFKPDQTLVKLQALLVVVSGLKYSAPPSPDPILEQYFDDAAQIPSYARGAIAAATTNKLVVNYPNVRQFQPMQLMTRGEVAALLCQAVNIPNAVPIQYIAWSLQLEDIQAGMTVPLDALKTNSGLTRQIQTKLAALQLYPDGRWIDGLYGPRLESALTEFCRVMGLPNISTRTLDQRFAETLLNVDAVTFILEQARDRQKIFNEFFQQESGFSGDKLAFLDRGIGNSPYRADLSTYPDRLKEKPDNQEVASLGTQVTLKGSNQTVTFTPYPRMGDRPAFDTTGLSFLHEDIPFACLCMGSVVDGKVRTRWLGKNALSNIELWSATKFIPLMNVIAKANSSFPAADVDNCRVRTKGGTGGFGFHEMARDVISYDNRIGTSNSLAVMFKQFETPTNLENWVKAITGNAGLVFRGRYGEVPYIQIPELWDAKLNRVLLTSSGPSHLGSNSMSVYDVTRLISLLGWHHHVPLEARVPGAQWDSLESLVRAMGTDSARYVDVAIARLGLNEVMRSPVILSKLGFGRSSIRNRTELVYTAFVQFVDKRPRTEGKPAVWRSLCLTLLGAKNLNDFNREATQLDARMAAEITEILRRVVTGELA